MSTISPTSPDLKSTLPQQNPLTANAATNTNSADGLIKQTLDGADAEKPDATGDAAVDPMITKLSDLQDKMLKTTLTINMLTAQYDIQKKVADAIRV